MDRRIETRVIDTGCVDGLGVLIQRDACEVWWITVCDKSTHAGELKLYDGFDAQGKLQWMWEGVPTKTHNFIPPIPCDQGIYIVSDDRVWSYTIAYRPKSWRKEQ